MNGILFSQEPQIYSEFPSNKGELDKGRAETVGSTALPKMFGGYRKIIFVNI